MGDVHFTITTDPSLRLLRITLRGFWAQSTIESYDSDLRHAGSRMVAFGCPRSELLAFVDARELSVQSQGLIALYKDRFDHPERRGRRIATLVSSALFKRQAERVAFSNQRIFVHEGEALQWLLS